MKRILVMAGVAGTFLFAACTEKGPAIDFGGKSTKVDTTYVQTNDTVQQRNVVIEEFTGVSCSNCPKGHTAIAGLETKYPGRVVAVGLYEKNNGNTDPNPLTVQDLRTDDATTICNTIYGSVNQLPGAGVDRVEAGTPASLQLDRSIWTTQVDARINVTAPVSLYINSSFDKASRVVTVTVRSVFTQAFNKNVKMTVGILEDSIMEAQEDNNPLPVHYDTVYTQNHVLRATISQATGDGFLASVANKEVGRVYQRTYKYTVPDAWIAEHCNIFAFIQTDDPGSKEILQGAETKLSQ
ncbi:MAG: Omp28-related outer membrane protein [Flavipsychrobacter sp.]